MIIFNNMEPLKISLESQNGKFLCPCPDQLKTNLKSKKLCVKRCLMSNNYVPIYVYEKLNDSERKYTFPDGTNIQHQNDCLKFMLGIRTYNTDTDDYTYNGGYLNFDPSLNENLKYGSITNPLNPMYYFCYDINKLCTYFSQYIVNFASFSDAFSCILQYNPANNMFILNVIESLLSGVEIICNKKFLDTFNFSASQIADDLYVLNFSMLYSTTINNIIYSFLTANVPFNFIPFDSVLVNCNLPVKNMTLLNNSASAKPTDFENIIQSFDRMTSSLLFYDFFVVDNSSITNYISFKNDNMEFTNLKFDIYLYSSKTNSKIPVNLNDGEFLNFELLICS